MYRIFWFVNSRHTRFYVAHISQEKLSLLKLCLRNETSSGDGALFALCDAYVRGWLNLGATALAFLAPGEQQNGLIDTGVFCKTATI